MKKNNKQDYFKKCKANAELGFSDALFELGTLYEYGEGVHADLGEAYECYRLAAEQGQIDAINKLGQTNKKEAADALSQNLDYDNEFDDIRGLYDKAIAGNADAQFNLAIYYSERYDSGIKLELAVELYKKAVKQDHAGAQNNLAVLYLKGKGVNKNPDKALELYKQSAKQGGDIAQNNLAWAYANGNIVTEDQKEATKWFKKSAIQGNADSQNTLGYRFEVGKGALQNYKEAVKWYKKAAKQGIDIAENNLANMYRFGKGELKDFKEAAKWYTKAAEQGYAPAQKNLGRLYIVGEGVIKDYKEAAKWCTKAAEQDDVYAQYTLYKHANDMSIDTKKSIDWLHKSAGKDILSNAKYDLKRHNFTSNDIKSYKKTVCKGYSESQYLLGTIYFKKGSTKDMSKSKYWINKAYENSYKSVTKKAEDFWNKHELWNYKDYKYKGIVEPTYEEKIRDTVQNLLTSEEVLLRAIFGERSDGNDFVIGYRLNGGIDVLRDPIKAIKHYKKAYKEGVSKAKTAYELGRIYFEEKSVQNYKEAVKWIKIAYKSTDTKINKKAEEFWNENELWNY